jgi:xanthine/uracil/vitamin C permease (AzgA family)
LPALKRTGFSPGLLLSRTSVPLPGIAAAWAAAHAVRSFLFGVTALDPLAIAAATAVLALTARVHPMEVLRIE